MRSLLLREVEIYLLRLIQNRSDASLGLLTQKKAKKEAVTCPLLVWKDPGFGQGREIVKRTKERV